MRFHRPALVLLLATSCMTEEEPPAPPLAQTQGAITLAQDIYTNGASVTGDPFYTGATSTGASVVPGASDAPLMVSRSNQLKLWLSKYTPVPGFADLHSHMFAEYAYGGGWFHGRAATGTEVQAMGTCDHGATIQQGFVFKGSTHVKKDTIAFAVAHIRCATRLVRAGWNWEERIDNFLGCLQPGRADALALHWLTGTHAALKVPLYLLQGDLFDDDGNHATRLGGFENGYFGWPTAQSGAHQQVWQGFLRQAHDQIPFAHFLKTHVYQTSGGTVLTDATTHTPLLQTAFVNAWTTTITNNAAWPRQKSYTGTTMTTFINDYHLALARLDFQGANYATYMQEARTAGKAGLNLIIVSAVDFKPLCELAPNFAGHFNLAFRSHDIDLVSSLGHADGGWQGTSNKCGEPAIFQQLAAAQTFATANAGWVSIVTTPDEARTAIAQGKLAMILSVEHTDLFDAVTDSSQIAAKVQDLAARKVGTFQLAHEFDNLYAGSAINNPVFAIFRALRTLYASNSRNLDNDLFNIKGPIEFLQSLTGRLTGYPSCQNFTSVGALIASLGFRAYIQGFKIKVELDIDQDVVASQALACLGEVMQKLKTGMQQCKVPGTTTTPVPCVKVGTGTTQMTASATMVNSVPTQHENIVGLKPFGRSVLDEMMNQGMPIDLAHLSTQTIRDIDKYLTQTNHCRYPMYISHAHVRGVETPVVRDKNGTPVTDNSTTTWVEGWGKNENYASDEVLALVAARGGMVGIRTGRTETATTITSSYPAGAGQGSTWSYAQIAQYLWSKGVNSTFATDLNGFIDMTKGRCNQASDLGCSTNKLNTDFDWKGLAHEGYLSDFFRDLVELDARWFGGTTRTATLNHLYGTEAYLRMWERARLLKSAPTWRANGWSCDEIEDRMLTAAGVTALNAVRPATPAAAPTATSAYTAISPRLTGFDNVGARVWYPKLGTNGATQIIMPVLAALDFVLPRDLNSSTIANSAYVTNMIAVLDGTLTADYSQIQQKSTITAPTACGNSVYGGNCSLTINAQTQYNTGQLDQNMFWTTWANLAWNGTFGAFGRMDDPVTTLSGNSTDVVWSVLTGVTQNGKAIYKSGTTTQWGDAAAWSSTSVGSTGGILRWTATEVATDRALGLSNLNSDNNYTSIDFGFLMSSTGSLTIVENGVAKGTVTTYVQGDTLAIQASGSSVKYSKNDVLLYTSAVVPVHPLYADASLKTAASTTSTAASLAHVSIYNFNDSNASTSSWMGCCAQQCTAALTNCDNDTACNLCIANDPAATGCSSNTFYQAVGSCLDTCRQTPVSAGGCGTGVVMCASNYTAPTPDQSSGLDTMASSGCTAYGGTCNFDFRCDSGETTAGCIYDCGECTGGSYSAEAAWDGYGTFDHNAGSLVVHSDSYYSAMQLTFNCAEAHKYEYVGGNCGTSPVWTTTGSTLYLDLTRDQPCYLRVNSVGQWHDLSVWLVQ